MNVTQVGGVSHVKGLLSVCRYQSVNDHIKEKLVRQGGTTKVQPGLGTTWCTNRTVH